MDPNHVVFDISSDEEETGGGGGGGDEEPRIEDYEWISELLNEDKVGEEKDDSDDVVVVGEVMHELNLKSLSAVGVGVGVKSSVVDDDDDCVILDDDPDKPVSVFDDAASRSESDELLVVGEKGQIACRDYPHPRHLCAKFPFGTTPHETHCDQCHCYVCDSLAPCVYWGTGSSIINHCHATDKDKLWKLERENAKLELIASQPIPEIPHTSVSMNQVPPPTHYNSQPRYPNYPRYPVTKPTAIRPCSSSTNFGVPGIISQSRSRPAGLIYPNNRLPSRTVPPKLLGVRNNIIRRDRSQNVGNVGHRSVPPPSLYKNAGSVGGSIAVNQSYNPLYDVNIAYVPPFSQNITPLAIPIDKNLSRWQDSLSSVNMQPNLIGNFENMLPVQPAVSSQPVSQPNDSQSIYQHGFQTVSPTDSKFSDIGISLVDHTIQSNQQSQTQNAQLRSTETIKDPSLVPDLTAQIPVSGANPASLYFDFEDWLLENQPFMATAPSHILSPQSSHIDTGLLYFDFETSLNGLTRT